MPGRGSGTDAGLPLDAHLHTDASADSDVPIDVYAAAAVARGIPELAITDHIDFEPGWPNHHPDVAARERTVRDAAERWAPHGVAIRFGVEVTYERRHEAAIREHLARTPYDYAIGSVHVGPDSPFRPARVTSWVAGRSLEDILAPYFDEVLGAIRSSLFDTIGHLDFVKRYLAPHVMPADLAARPEVLEPLLVALAGTGTALEVNTSGLRQTPGETYPAPWAVARFRELGGERVVTGSDAHRADWFAWGLAEGYEALLAAGFRSVTFRRGGAPVTIGIGDLARSPNGSAG
jgi:histidinol-phosphatase (PHP family)